MENTKNQENMDTVNLLKECDSGTKMAVASIDEVTDKVSDIRLKELLTESKRHHEKLGNELHRMLIENNSSEQDPNPLAKGMSWIKTNVMISMKESDQTIADIMTDGCDMGVKSLYKYLNQYGNAGQPAIDICNRLINIEETLRRDLRAYL